MRRVGVGCRKEELSGLLRSLQAFKVCFRNGLLKNFISHVTNTRQYAVDSVVPSIPTMLWLLLYQSLLVAESQVERLCFYVITSSFSSY